MATDANRVTRQSESLVCRHFVTVRGKAVLTQGNCSWFKRSMTLQDVCFKFRALTTNPILVFKKKKDFITARLIMCYSSHIQFTVVLK